VSVARIKSVKKARKDQGECGDCGKQIRAGQPYKWWTVGFRSRYKHKRCDECITPMPSARESNPKVAAILAVEETFDTTSAKCREDLVSVLEDAASGIRDAGEQWTESADEMEQGFGHETEQSNEQREKGEAAEGWAEAIENAVHELDEEKGEDESDDEYIERLRTEAQSAFDDNQMDY